MILKIRLLKIVKKENTLHLENMMMTRIETTDGFKFFFDDDTDG